MTNKFTNNLQQMVKEFQETFGHPVEEKPTLLSLQRLVDRKGWGSLEEIIEQVHSVSNNKEEFLSAVEQIKGYLDKAVEKQLEKEFIQDEQAKIVALGDGLGDELYFLLGDAVEAGIDIEPVFKTIHNSNMSKLYKDEETGKTYVKYDENNKVQKSPNFVPPEPLIEKEIERQIKEAE